MDMTDNARMFNFSHTKPWKCAQCTASFPTEYTLREHKYQQHAY